ncbi:zinc-binding alcohol dehydrogenase family protein [Paenibacillus whitsoniae]|uniref:Zinc-type alcohol dehydrogenase-like protein n=2 Tax=Paenibacillus whitsoniae TaxID=2496558 RepID=A0A3S0CFQ1_9BACL|nr:zinc-binding alcohol dehydrogenase family protein [Paenibacillus whitsoniae]
MSMTLMKAVGLTRYLPIDREDSLMDVQVEKPAARGRDLLVRVQAISVNPVDVKVRSPKERVEAEPRVLGWDVAGIVVEAGEDATLFEPGDEVYYAGSIVRPGGNSEFHLVDERIVGRKPRSLDFAEAAALPLTTITAWESLFDRLGISREASGNEGRNLLIIGAAGGVGSIATQLAAAAGLTVIGTASRPETVRWVKELGAAHTISHREPLVPQLRQIGFDTVDYILCLNSTELHWAQMAEAIAPQGRICSIVETSEPLNLNLLKDKSATFSWELMFTRSRFGTPDMIEQHRLLNEVADRVDAGKLRTTVTKRLSPINAATLKEAHALIETGSTIGKIVIAN